MTDDTPPINGVVYTSTDLGRLIETGPNTHPATQAILRYFDYEHLPEHLQWVSQPFHDLAHNMAYNFALSGPEVTAGLRKLLEAKDCAVRAAL